jgi:hypothetical protein
MALLPTIKKILREDVKDAPAWISAVIEPFNSLAEFVYQSLNKNITFNDNISCFIKELSYKTPSTYPTMADVEFTNDLKFKATGVQLLQAVDRSNYVPAAGPVYVPWVENNGTIVISSIPGLAASKTYLIRLLVS